jgi:hypothetical protein
MNSEGFNRRIAQLCYLVFKKKVFTLNFSTELVLQVRGLKFILNNFEL